MTLYCNPLALTDYQPGRYTDDPDHHLWVREDAQDYREMADPTVIEHDGRWYLYPSAGVCWHSDDLLGWTHEPLDPFDPGYAPDVVEYEGDFYLTACGGGLWRAPDPLGPFEDVGPVRDETGEPAEWMDPCLFVDDGRLYCYYGLGPDGIYAVEMAEDDPSRFAHEPVNCFAFEPDHAFERFGEHNEDYSVSYVEGAWTIEHEGRYYLLYSVPGTQWKNYALGCYVAEDPLGPWAFQDRNPVLDGRDGLVNGTAHGSVVEGPAGNLWCFYTVSIRIEHGFERRIGMDPVGFDEDGNLFVAGPTETPRRAPGERVDPARHDDAGLDQVTVNKPVTASSAAPGRDPQYAVDDEVRTWWTAAAGDDRPTLAVDLMATFEVSAARTMFADRGLDYEAGVTPGPYRYRIEARSDGGEWSTLADRTDAADDRHVTFDEFEATPADELRLVVDDWPDGMDLGVWEFTAFGRHELVA